MTDTLYVHLYGGPGTGKSTTRALTFGTLKQRGRNAEETPEFAKDLTWEKRGVALGFQPYIFGKQTYKEHRLDGQVEVVLSDTSPLLSLIYPPPKLPVWWDDFSAFVISYYASRRVLNVLLTRDPNRPYNPKGRNQAQAEAEALDEQIRGLLDDCGETYLEVQVDREGNTHVNTIVGNIEALL